jgi:peptide chain release factor 2
MSRIVVRREDCRRAFFKGSGPGGQHRNKTETCVRYVHLPTGIQAEGKSERSRHANDEAAWSLLLAKVARMEDDRSAIQAMADWAAKPDASYSSQARSYFLTGPERRVIDHRSGHRSADPASVLRGRIDGFLRHAIDARKGA